MLGTGFGGLLTRQPEKEGATDQLPSASQMPRKNELQITFLFEETLKRKLNSNPQT